MHITSRLMRASSMATQQEAAAVITGAVAHVNKQHGTNLGAAVQVGGDALLFGVSGNYERLADYEALRAALASDTEFHEILKSGEGLFTDMVEDTIWKSRIPPGEPAVFAQVSTANVLLTSVDAAMTFCAEVSATVAEILGNQVGLATAVTGDRSRILWVGFSSSLAEMEADGDTLDASADYLDLFKRSEGVIVPNTLEQQIWQNISG